MHNPLAENRNNYCFLNQYGGFLRFISLFFLLILPGLLFSQKAGFKINGTVLDEETGEAIPFIPVKLKGTTFGSNTNLDGFFELTVPSGNYLLEVNYTGYQPYRDSLKIYSDKTNIQIKLSLSKIIEEIVITDKSVNPAIRIVKNAIKNRKKNSMDDIDAFEYDAYNKLVISMDKLTDNFFNMRLLKGAKPVIDEIKRDTSVQDSGKFKMAVFVSESFSHAWFLKPAEKKEQINAVKTSGVKSSEYNLLNSMITSVNFYQNYVNILDKQFMSPIADGAFGNYEFYLKSYEVNGIDTMFRIEILAKRPFDKVFKGVMFIENRDWSINRIDVTMNDNPNINFIENFRIRQDFIKVDSYYVQSFSDVEVDFINSLIKGKRGEGVGLIGRNATYRYNYTLNQPKEVSFYRQEIFELNSDAQKKDTAFWNKRPVPLDRSEQLGYAMVDSLRSRGFLDFYINAIRLVTFGLKEFKYFDVGPYFYLIGFNQIEGPRVRCGIYTKSELSNKWYFGGHLAYGIKDQRYKYNIDIKHRFVLKPKLELGISRTEEVEQTGFDDFVNNGSSILATSLRRVPFTQLNYFTENKIYLNQDVGRGFALNAFVRTKSFEPAFPIYFKEPGGELRSFYSTTEAGVNLRISFKERYIIRDGNKVYLPSKYPVFNVSYTKGFNDFLGGEFDYNEFLLKITDKIRMGRFGYTNYFINSGAIIGTVPVPTLHIFRAQQSYGYDPWGFNLLRIFEFTADRFVEFGFSHHLDGWIWSKFPALRALKIKEVVTGRLAYGTMTDENKKFNLTDAQGYMVPEKTPYLEAGVGLENILKLFRIDAIWRLNYHKPGIENFGFRVYMTLAF